MTTSSLCKRTKLCGYHLILLFSFLTLDQSRVLAWSQRPRRVVVVGKVIIDEYGNNGGDDDNKTDLRIGGGGPQAAWGAAAALAVMQHPPFQKNGDLKSSSRIKIPPAAPDDLSPPPKMPVTFLGPVGDLDWTTDEDDALHNLLNPVADRIKIIHGENLNTPRIRLWHDENEIVQWKALNDSFGMNGADALWRNRPCAEDILNTLAEEEKGVMNGISREEEEDSVILHVIVEAGANAAGKQQDAQLLFDATLRSRTDYIGIEPIAFPQPDSMLLSSEDVASAVGLLERLSSSSLQSSSSSRSSSRDDNDDVANHLLLSPDIHFYESVRDEEVLRSFQVAVRNGAQGSTLLNNNADHNGDNNTPPPNITVIPAAALLTPNGEPINPTGAGNAYAAAMTACRGCGATMIEAACVATAIGAVVCEYEHLPPWDYEVLDRIRSAVEEVSNRVGDVKSLT